MLDREREALQLYSRLCGGETDTPFTGVVGITGNGKTALVQAAARRYGWRFPDGVAYFSMRSEFSPTLIRDLFGGDQTARQDADSPRETALWLSKGRHLLIFDDLEEASADTVGEVISLLAAWDTSLGGRAILVSHTHRPELQAIVGPNWLTVGQLPEDAARTLLVSCLGGRDEASRIVGPDLPEVTQLCFWHPKTIESAAALLQLGQRWEDLRDDLAKLSGQGPLGVNDEIMGRVLERLEQRVPIVRDLLDAWSVFGDRCHEMSWRVVAAGSSQSVAGLRSFHNAALKELQGARLIDRFDIRGETRCVMHPLVVAHLRRRHAELSRERLQDFARLQLGEQAKLASADRSDEYPTEESSNIRRGLTVAQELELWPEIVRYCLVTVGDQSARLVRRGPWPLALELLDTGERAAHECAERHSEVTFLLVRGTVQYRLAAFAPAMSAYDHAAAGASEVGASGLELAALRGKGQVLYRIGDFDAAATMYQQARDVAERIDERALADVDHQHVPSTRRRCGLSALSAIRSWSRRRSSSSASSLSRKATAERPGDGSLRAAVYLKISATRSGLCMPPSVRRWSPGRKGFRGRRWRPPRPPWRRPVACISDWRPRSSHGSPEPARTGEPMS